MRLLMGHHVLFPSKGFLADIANERLLIIMARHVIVQVSDHRTTNGAFHLHIFMNGAIVAEKIPPVREGNGASIACISVSFIVL